MNMRTREKASEISRGFEPYEHSIPSGLYWATISTVSPAPLSAAAACSCVASLRSMPFTCGEQTAAGWTSTTKHSKIFETQEHNSRTHLIILSSNGHIIFAIQCMPHICSSMHASYSQFNAPLIFTSQLLWWCHCPTLQPRTSEH